MQFTFFHLMPYRPLDMAERHKHRAAWVVLPNTLYDPKKGADEYQSYIDQLVYAEKLGFDVIAVNEHHQTAYGMMPAPNLIAGEPDRAHQQGQDRDHRPRAAAGEQSGQHRRRVRDARQPVARAASSPASCAASATSITRPASTRTGRTSATRRRTT